MCLADGSCQCPFDSDICKHVEAAGNILQSTHRMRLAAATELIERNQIKVLSVERGIFQCPTFADPSKKFFEFNTSSGFCSCFDWLRNGICCHLLAAKTAPECQHTVNVLENIMLLKEEELNLDSALTLKHTRLDEIHLGEPGLDPGADISKELELPQILKAITGTSKLNDTQKEIKTLASRIGTVGAGLEDEEQQLRLRDVLKGAVDEFEGLVPEFCVTHQREVKNSDPRKPNDNKNNPLFIGRRKKSELPHALDSVVTDLDQPSSDFAIVVPSGRPRSKAIRPLGEGRVRR